MPVRTSLRVYQATVTVPGSLFTSTSISGTMTYVLIETPSGSPAFFQATLATYQ